MLTCYLDDSGKDPQNHLTTLAGYLAREDEWKSFEAAVEPVFERYGVKILHAKDLEDTHGEFKGWKVLKKQSFVAEISKILAKHSLIGLSYSLVKQTYKDRAAASGKKRVVTPYAYAFNIILDWILRDIRTGKAVWSDGLAFVLECGHENNPDLQEQFWAIRKRHALESVLKSLIFVPKDNCRAIQVADLRTCFPFIRGGMLPPRNASIQPVKPIMK